MLIFLFSAWACAAVGRTAQEVVKEVRRQFIERPGIMVSLAFFFPFCKISLAFFFFSFLQNQFSILTKYLFFRTIRRNQNMDAVLLL